MIRNYALVILLWLASLFIVACSETDGSETDGNEGASVNVPEGNNDKNDGLAMMQWDVGHWDATTWAGETP